MKGTSKNLLRSQSAALGSARNLAYLADMSRLLRAGRLASWLLITIFRGALKGKKRSLSGCLLALLFVSASCSEDKSQGQNGQGDESISYREDALVETNGAKTERLTLVTINLAVGFGTERMIKYLFGQPKMDEMVADTRQIYNEMESARPTERIGEIAGAIAELDPDIVALQEVMEVKRDDLGFHHFLDELTAILSDQGFHFSAVYQATPSMDLPLLTKDGTVDLSFHEGNALLFREEFEITEDNQVLFDAKVGPIALPDGSVNIERGLQQVRLKTGSGLELKVFNTHLEIQLFSEVHTAQVKQLLDLVEQAKSDPLPLFVLGDFNDPPGGTTYKAMVDLGFLDSFGYRSKDAGPTCCADIIEGKDDRLDQRIDFIFARNIAAVVKVSTGISGPFEADDGKTMYSSDHLGVIAEFDLIR